MIRKLLPLLTLSLAFIAVGCNSDDLKKTVDANAACFQVPPGSADQTACPGASGTYTHFTVVYDAGGANITSNKRYCGASASDVPASQADYNSRIVNTGETSRNDFANSSHCASGSKTTTINSNVTRDIWQKVD